MAWNIEYFLTVLLHHGLASVVTKIPIHYFMKIGMPEKRLHRALINYVKYQPRL